jgi:HlyD family secretion protein
MLSFAAPMARITPFHLLPVLIAAASQAGEITIEPRPFAIENSFVATALPAGDCTLLKLEPKAWQSYPILTLTAHGSAVKKGETLVSFDAEDIDKKLADMRRDAATSTLALAQAEQDFKALQETAPNKLEAFRRAATTAKEENEYFTKTRRKASEGRAAQALKRVEQMLANQREELRQLEKMYQEDDLTEETEEIILARQKDTVAAAEFVLSMEILDHKRTLEVLLPREAKNLADSERDTAIALTKAELDIPRSLETAKLDLDGKRIAHQRAKQQLAEIEADRQLFEFKAPADGFFYHGPIENGRWTPGELVKTLVPRAAAPLHRNFATFVPAAAKLALVSFLDEATARALPAELAGTASLSGREDLEIPVKLLKVANLPGTDGTYRADFSFTLAEGFTLPTGSSARVNVISYQQPAALVVPTRALQFNGTGWTVEVKLADGKTEQRSVKRGRTNKEDTEILAGIEVGQVIVLPEK